MKESINSYYAKSRYVPAGILSSRNKPNASIYSTNESAYSTEKSSFDLLKSFDYLNSEDGRKMGISRFKQDNLSNRESSNFDKTIGDFNKNILNMTSTKYLDALIRKNHGDKKKKFFINKGSRSIFPKQEDTTLPIINKNKNIGDYKYNEFQYRNPLTTKFYLHDITEGVFSRNIENENKPEETFIQANSRLQFTEGKVEKNKRIDFLEIEQRRKKKSIASISKNSFKQIQTGSEFLRDAETKKLKDKIATLKKIERFVEDRTAKMRKKYFLDESDQSDSDSDKITESESDG